MCKTPVRMVPAPRPAARPLGREKEPKMATPKEAEATKLGRVREPKPWFQEGNVNNLQGTSFPSRCDTSL